VRNLGQDLLELRIRGPHLLRSTASRAACSLGFGERSALALEPSALELDPP
jgi:hypothetical protein